MSGRAFEDLRIRYLHGRPGPHPLHGRLARELGADFEFVDHRMRWQDLDRSRAYRIVSSLVCAATLPRRSEYDLFLVDDLHIGPVLMKGLFLRPDQKIVVHLGSQVLYFLHSRHFGPAVHAMHLWALARYDALICEGEMAAEIALELLGASCPPTYTTFGGPRAERGERLRRLAPELGGSGIVLVTSGPNRFRMHYKGLDLMIAAFGLAAAALPDLTFDILGEWDEAIRTELLSGLSPATRSRVRFHGAVEGIEPHLERASLYLQCTRGDAFPGATIEAMTAGVPTLVSEWTGTRQIVLPVEPRLVAPLEPAAVAGRILWYMGLPLAERRRLGGELRAAASLYTEEAARRRYREAAVRMCRDLRMID